MLITDIKCNEGNNNGHVGLALIGEMTRVCGLDTLVDRLGPSGYGFSSVNARS